MPEVGLQSTDTSTLNNNNSIASERISRRRDSEENVGSYKAEISLLGK